ncbi:hypothetical protein BH09PAT4_BH09PAT4_07640 [soil metagenome]
MTLPRRGPATNMAIALLLASGVSLFLYVVLVQRMGELVFTYLPSNLLLAWIPVLLALWLGKLLRTHLWSSWPALAVTGLWLIFLPNSFYVITDLIHLGGVYSDDLVASAIVFFSFTLTGLLLGYTSVYLVHGWLRARTSARRALALIAGVFLLCSIAIYIGRDLRWNSWDMLFQPSGLLFDLSDRLLHPSEYGKIATVAGGFFVLLLSMYETLLRAARAVAKAPLL